MTTEAAFSLIRKDDHNKKSFPVIPKWRRHNKRLRSITKPLDNQFSRLGIEDAETISRLHEYSEKKSKTRKTKER